MNKQYKILQENITRQVFPSQFDIGDPVFIQMGGKQLSGNIRTVTFTSGKVRYSVRVDEPTEDGKMSLSTLHNIDSIWVKPNPNGKKVDLDFDNYS